MNEMYESRDFYKPIVTPYDIETALNPQTTGLNFSYDYNSFLEKSELDPDLEFKIPANDVSLLTGKLRSHLDSDTNEDSSALAVKSDGTLAVQHGFLENKSWRGLEQKLGEDEPAIAVEGRSGIASGYENEKT